jgi:hypothetical protein
MKEECVNCALLGAVLRQLSFAVNEVPGIWVAKVSDKVPAVRYEDVAGIHLYQLIYVILCYRDILADHEQEIRPLLILYLSSNLLSLHFYFTIN